MTLNLPGKKTFWAAVVMAAVTIIFGIMDVFGYIFYMGGIGYSLLFVAFVLLCVEPIKQQLPRKKPFWVAVVIATASVVVYNVHNAFSIQYLGLAGYCILFIAFILLCLVQTDTRRLFPVEDAPLKEPIPGLPGGEKQPVQSPLRIKHTVFLGAAIFCILAGGWLVDKIASRRKARQAGRVSH
jgi:hypothetical protein